MSISLAKYHKLVLQENTVQIWHIDFNAQITHLDVLHSLLDSNEKVRAGKFRFDKHRNTFVVARGAARVLLGKYLNRNPRDISFQYQKNGKPFIPEDKTCHFNVSHSDSQILLGFCATHPLGVDVEKITHDFDVMEVAENYFYGDEIIALKSLPASIVHHGFFSLWTRKEAIIKYDGRGLSIPLDSFSVSLDTINPKETTQVDWQAQWETDYILHTLKAENDYKAACAVHKSVETIKVFDKETTHSLFADI